MKEKQTQELLNILKDTSSINSLEAIMEFKENAFSDTTFSEYFLSITDNNIDRAEYIKKANMHRTYGYQILNGQKMPGRDKVIALCLAAEISLDEVQHCLRYANQPQLYARNRRDAILIYAINNKISVIDTNSILLDFKEDILN